jgi:hypothetical protein
MSSKIWAAILAMVWRNIDAVIEGKLYLGK